MQHADVDLVYMKSCCSHFHPVDPHPSPSHHSSIRKFLQSLMIPFLFLSKDFTSNRHYFMHFTSGEGINQPTDVKHLNSETGTLGLKTNPGPDVLAELPSPAILWSQGSGRAHTYLMSEHGPPRASG